MRESLVSIALAWSQGTQYDADLIFEFGEGADARSVAGSATIRSASERHLFGPPKMPRG